MSRRVSGVFACAALLLALGAAASAEVSSAATTVTAQASKREPTASQMAVRERQRKCAAEWKSKKAAGAVPGDVKWPKFWSQCNARLKGNSA